MLQQDKPKWEDIVAYMKTLSPSGIELELISLSSFEIDKTKETKLQSPNMLLERMLGVFSAAVRSNTDSDFVQAILNNFLQNHYDLIVQDDDLSAQLSEVRSLINNKFERLENLIGGNLCMAQYFSGLNEF